MKISKIFTPGKTVAIAVAVIIMTLLFVVLPLSLGSIAKNIVMEYGPDAIGADVVLNHVYISALSGKLKATDLEIGNPKSYGRGFSIKAPSIKATAKPFAVFRKEIVIDSVVVDNMLINYIKAGKADNIDALRRNVDKSTSDSWLMKDRKFVIKSLLLKSPRVIWHPPIIKKSVTFDLPDIHMTNVGEGGALSSSEVMSLIISKMLPPVSRAISLNAEQLKSDTENKARKVESKVKQFFKRK
ncbi:MAG: hypothetical protein HN337_08460 [Deltaproteobacteria bacterium]|jgi:uncharacterized protein involved in outer membrane biogenesis|nr:hypothetical protein [Deltaproteobacteria bacterium]